MQNFNKKKKTLDAFRILALGFATVIFTGATLLSMPFSSATGQFTNFLDTLFTATSAVCVTGLITLDTGLYWSMTGKTIIIILIEIGGLGFMAMSTIFALVLKKKITLKDRLVMQEAYNTFNLQGIISHVRYMIIFTLCVQGIAALVLMTQFIPMVGVGMGIYYGIWHSISAFCNAGFDLLGNFTSVTVVNDNKVILLTLANLINIGGLGYLVWRELLGTLSKKRKLRNISLHAKVVVTISLIMVIGGTLAFLILEWNNPLTMKDMTFGNKLVNSYFSTTTPRTAGFNSISNSGMSPASKLITMAYMFIGGSPGGTAGGVKTTTFGIIIFTLIAVLKGRSDVEIYKKKLSQSTVYKAIAIFFLGLTIVVIGVVILSINEIGASFEEIVYEVLSAFGTVGLTMGITPGLQSVSKLTLILIMYMGRVGPLTVMLAISNKQEKINIKYPEGKLLIG
ncbi:MAG: potassium transporter TrkG [Clostridiaceae bacterium]